MGKKGLTKKMSTRGIQGAGKVLGRVDGEADPEACG